MTSYFFIPGRNPALSVAEIISLLNLKQIKFSFGNLSNEALIVLTEEKLDTLNLMKNLGGTVKVGEVLDEVLLDENENEFFSIFLAANLSVKYLSKKEGKIHFGVSIYNAGGVLQHVNELVKQLKSINMEIKDNLKKNGVTAGFVQIKDRFLSSVSVEKNRLLTDGFEMVILVTPKSLLAGRTLSVQEFESFSFRDFQRPAKDKKSGIMPPKLARMMINIAGFDNNKKILDPFCGSGTIIQETVFLGKNMIIGSDISQKAVIDTKNNLDWVFQNYHHLDRDNFNIRIEIMDVKQLGKKLPREYIDIIVTEPYLGPPIFRNPDMKTAERIFNELSGLYTAAFIEFQKVLKRDGTIVIILPAFEINNRVYFMPILSKLKKIGFKTEDLIPQEISQEFRTEITSRKTILYGGRDQFVKREILKFKRI